MQAFITATAGLKEYNDVRGKMFEPLAHRIVGGGGSFDVWDLEVGVCAAPLLDPHSKPLPSCAILLFCLLKLIHIAFHTCLYCYQILLCHASAELFVFLL